jgi:hypothetical protein
MVSQELSPTFIADLRTELAETLMRSGMDRPAAGTAADRLVKVLAEFNLISHTSYNAWLDGFIAYAKASGWSSDHFEHLRLPKPN